MNFVTLLEKLISQIIVLVCLHLLSLIITFNSDYLSTLRWKSTFVLEIQVEQWKTMTCCFRCTLTCTQTSAQYPPKGWKSTGISKNKKGKKCCLNCYKFVNARLQVFKRCSSPNLFSHNYTQTSLFNRFVLYLIGAQTSLWRY